MKKVFDKIIKGNKSKPQLEGVHYTNEKLELTDANIAIIEEYKQPLNTSFDFLVGIDSKPKIVNYPELTRIVPTNNTNKFVIDIPLLESIVKLNKKEFGLELTKDGLINGNKVGYFERDVFDFFDHITFSPKLLLIMIEYLKESGLKKNATMLLSNSALKPAVIFFEETNSNNTFIITPIRTEKDMK